jgi:hypothetical protein
MRDLARSVGSVLLAGALAVTVVPVLTVSAQASSGTSMAVEKSKKKWVRYTVSPGAFCSDRGWYGKTKRGVTMRCKTTSADSRYRWRR